MTLKRTGKVLLKRSSQFLIIGCLTFFLFELCFRLYLIDFYASNFNHLNSDFKRRSAEKDLIIVGDSFSAFKDGYSKVVYDSLSDYNVNNYSVPGTSVREQYLFGKFHVKRHKPEVLVFQFYVGNDLFSWDHPGWNSEISLIRKTYWSLSEYFWSLSFINHSLLRFKSGSSQEKVDNRLQKHFDPDLFSYRDRLYYKAEPGLIENTAYLTNGRLKDLRNYMVRMKKLFSYTCLDCDIYVVIVPHAAQVNEAYQHRTEQLGALFSSVFKPGQEDYPLFNEMTSFFSSDTRVEILNPLSEFKAEEENGREMYYVNDSHLNAHGQRVLGNFLIKAVKNHD